MGVKYVADENRTTSASDASMQMVRSVHGQLTQREYEIAQTAARAAYRYAMREMVELLQEKVRHV
jgi:hypothetical protein